LLISLRVFRLILNPDTLPHELLKLLGTIALTYLYQRLMRMSVNTVWKYRSSLSSLNKTTQRRLSLNLFLVLPFLLQISTAVGLVWWLSFKSGQDAIYSLVRQLETDVSARVNQHLDASLELPHQLNQINANAIQRGILDPNDFESAGQYFWQQAQVFPTINWIGYNLKTGQGTGAGRWFGNQELVINRDAAKQVAVYQIDRAGNYGKQLAQLDFDPLSRDWYRQTAEAGRPIWSKVEAIGDLDGYIAVSANTPISDQTGQMIGVLGTDISLDNLSLLLRQVNASPSGRVFILERNGLLIADSSDHKPFTVIDGKIQRLKALENQDPLIRLAAQQVQQQLGSFETIQAQADLTFRLEGEQQFAQVTPWKDAYGLDWLVVTVLPESDFMTQIEANNRTTILLCAITFVVATLLGLITARWITRPILHLSQASQAIAEGDLNQTAALSGLKEIDLLAHAFNRMSGQLKTAFNRLEEANATLENRVEERTAELTETLQDLQQTQTQLIHAEKMSSLGQLVAGVAHEINNPVNFIHGNINYADEYLAQLLELVQLYEQETQSTPALENKLEEIDLAFIQQDLPKLMHSMRTGTERIREIVLMLRNFSRLDEAEAKEADIHEGIDSSLMILQNRLKVAPGKPTIQVVKSYGEIPLIHCYPGQLNQVFMNLLTNAIDALMARPEWSQPAAADLSSPAPWQPTITICTEVIAQNQVRIRVADNGTGIPEAAQRRLFDPFFTTKPVGQGTGLGLSISYKIIVEKHQGKLMVASQVNQGTEFVIMLPLVSELSQAA
jgi:signal transduction histidine kinase